jgi:hypothetical protein
MKAPFREMILRRNRTRKMRSNHQRCNICDRLFRAASSFHRFCKSCKSDDERFKFSEWLPQT